jgi:radical SAM/Cys-rich protein
MTFAGVLRQHGLELRRATPRSLQLNLGKHCNQTCIHCHVEAGPGRTEIMTAEVADRCIEWMRRFGPPIVDLTGGAPEFCPEFRRLVVAARGTGARVLVRCNLTVFFEPGQEDLPRFFRDQAVEVVASLPCYGPENVDFQRGQGTFEKSIRALRLLNGLGYGIRPDLVLTLVYNPVGPNLPGVQAELEAAYRRELRAKFGIEFHRLHCLANLPVTRFRRWLEQTGRLAEYEALLLESFNPATVEGLMCRDTINVGWQGDLYDCDFNQMISMPMGGAERRFLWDLDPETLALEPVATGRHCFGCTAGHGSTCGGAIV